MTDETTPQPPDPAAPLAWHAGYAGAAAAGARSRAASPATVGPGRAAGRRADGRRRSIVTLVAATVVVVLASGTGGAAIAIAVAHPAPASPVASPRTTGAVDVAAIAARIDPAIVDITTQLGAGTGMILTSTGEVLTNNHVVSGATQITARIEGKGRTYPAQVLGVDPTADVALIQLVGASGLPTVHLGSSTGLVIGEQVVAIGNALDLSGPPTVTAGIVSALDRSITATDAETETSENLSGLVQTDAPINPGNSGGPLVDAAGDVIGMNTAAVDGSAAQPATNIGFAIPVDTAAAIVSDVRAGRSSPAVLLGERGLIGVEVLTVAEAEGPEGLATTAQFYGGGYKSPVKSGAVVYTAEEGDPAVAIGIQAGDVIVSFAGHPVTTPLQLTQLIGRYRPYDKVSVGWVDIQGGHHTGTLVLAISTVK